MSKKMSSAGRKPSGKARKTAGTTKKRALVGTADGEVFDVTISSPDDGGNVGLTFTAQGTVSPGTALVYGYVVLASNPDGPRTYGTPFPAAGPNWSLLFQNVPAGELLLVVAVVDGLTSHTITVNAS